MNLIVPVNFIVIYWKQLSIFFYYQLFYPIKNKNTSNWMYKTLSYHHYHKMLKSQYFIIHRSFRFQIKFDRSVQMSVEQCEMGCFSSTHLWRLVKLVSYNKCDSESPFVALCKPHSHHPLRLVNRIAGILLTQSLSKGYNL